jgi:N,N'-diacetylchitobiose phosphorylase
MRYGYFDDENLEYVIERPDIPVSWTNYIGVRDLCSVLSHNAGGYSFYKSAEHHRITRFRQNGIPLDRPGHYVYIRDDEPVIIGQSPGSLWVVTILMLPTRSGMGYPIPGFFVRLMASNLSNWFSSQLTTM